MFYAKRIALPSIVLLLFFGIVAIVILFAPALARIIPWVDLLIPCFVFFALVSLITVLVSAKALREEKTRKMHSGEPQLKKGEKAGTPPPTEKKRDWGGLWKKLPWFTITALVVGLLLYTAGSREPWLRSDAGRWFIVCAVLFVLLLSKGWFRRIALFGTAIVLTMMFLYGRQKTFTIISSMFSTNSEASENLHPQYNPSTLAISRHVYEKDAEGKNNHEEQTDLKYFDVVLTGDVGDSGKGEFGKEGHVKPPKNWFHWKIYWVSNEPDRHVGFLYSGDTVSIGPFNANLPPENDSRFTYKVREWMLQGLGTLRFECVSGCPQ